ncbi:MAG: histidinol-phosphatase [Campylobacterales bacterium]
MLVDLHNHTPLCNHAKGEPIEFVQKAIEHNISVFGFSDHAPMNFDEAYRMGFDEMDKYEKTVLELKSEYKNQINIKLAYEVDYLPGFIDSRVLDRDVDYLIGSVHFIGGWGFDNPEFIGDYKGKNPDETWSEYFRLIGDMAKSGHFNIVGHMDLLKVFNFKPSKDTVKLGRYALDEIKKAGMAIEINASGLRKPVAEQYPSNELLSAALELQIPITFGSDAHDPSHIGYKLTDNLQKAKEIGFLEYANFTERKMELIKI